MPENIINKAYPAYIKSKPIVFFPGQKELNKRNSPQSPASSTGKMINPVFNFSFAGCKTIAAETLASSQRLHAIAIFSGQECKKAVFLHCIKRRGSHE
jgi:hypothetical protein